MQLKARKSKKTCCQAGCKKPPVEIEDGADTWFCKKHSKAGTQEELAVLQEGFENTLSELVDLEIEDADDVAFAEDSLKSIKGQWNEYEEKRTSATKPLNKSLKEINSWFKPVQMTLKKLEALWKRKIVEYTQRVAEEQRLLIEEARQSDEPEEIKEALVAASEAVPATKSVTLIDKWVFEVVDESKIPREFMMPDDVKIGKVVAVLKGGTTIPGIRAYNDQIVRSPSR